MRCTTQSLEWTVFVRSSLLLTLSIESDTSAGIFSIVFHALNRASGSFSFFYFFFLFCSRVFLFRFVWLHLFGWLDVFKCKCVFLCDVVDYKFSYIGQMATSYLFRVIYFIVQIRSLPFSDVIIIIVVVEVVVVVILAGIWYGMASHGVLWYTEWEKDVILLQ